MLAKARRKLSPKLASGGLRRRSLKAAAATCTLRGEQPPSRSPPMRPPAVRASWNGSRGGRGRSRGGSDGGSMRANAERARPRRALLDR